MDFWLIMSDLCKGFGETLKLFALTLVIAIPLGLLLSFCSMSRFKPLSWLTKGFIWISRGTPLLLQCVIVTFVPSVVLHIPNKDFMKLLHLDSIASLQFLFVLIAFGINYACYFAVIFEGGIKNVPKGQREAGQVLGMTKRQIFTHVILMQVVRKIVAPMSNEIITLVKDTALARTLGVAEILMVAYEKVNYYAVLSPLLYAGGFYLAFSGLLTVLFHLLEKKIGYYEVA
ncbi:MAG: amino acid ABC transporter permease [Clostridia bacterium]|nr:amino acid ABC transporter permease [Clostridia bacterium]